MSTTEQMDLKGVSMETTGQAKRFARDEIRNILESIVIKVESVAPLYGSRPDQFVRETEVKFTVGYRFSDQVEIGHARMFSVNGNLARYHYNCPLFYVCDAHSQDLCDIYHAFFKDRGEWIDEVEICEIFTYDFLYLDYLYLKPEYRGYRIGRFLARALIEEFAKEGEVVIAWPVPVELQEKKGEQIVSYQTERETVTSKLVAMCERLGFIRLKGTNMLFLPMTEQYRTVSDMLRKMFPEYRRSDTLKVHKG